jgi:hypothetical protein
VSVYDTLRCTLAQALGTARLPFDACQIPLGVSAFSLSSWSSVSLTEGDVLSALGASGAFPVQILKSQSSIVAVYSKYTRALTLRICCPHQGLWAPLRLGPPTYALCTDVAAIVDPAGIAALPALPPSGRLLHIAAADWNLRRWLLIPPSKLPKRLLACWRKDGGGSSEDAQLAAARGGGESGMGVEGQGGGAIEVVSVVLEGHTPVLPWGFQERGIL